jgi:hypothetical protein
MESIYRIDDNLLTLVHKTYDDKLFGKKVFELLESNNESGLNIKSSKELSKDLNKVSFCTFRGKYNLKVIHFLEDNNFRFIDDFLHLRLKRKDYVSNKFSFNKTSIIKINGEPSDEVKKELIELEKSVYDFSTFQADYRIENNISSERNGIRVASHFNNPEHLIYLSLDQKSKKINGFHQFIKKTNYAVAVNTAVKTDNQSHALIGPKLFIVSHDDILEDKNIKYIDSGCGFNNGSSLRLHFGFNYSIHQRDIHLRKITK